MSLPCGANLDFGAITDATSDLKSTLTSQLGGNFTSATALKSAVEGKLTSVTSGLSSLVPEIPELPALSLQSELTSLAAIDLTTPAGLLDYQSKLSSITDSFGSALSSSGFNLDTIVSQVAPSTGALSSVSGALSNITDAASGASSLIDDAISSVTGSLPSLPSAGDVCELCPNFKLPSGATEAIQEATNPKLSSVAGIKEEFTEFTANVDFTAKFEEATAKANEILADPDVQAQISSDVASASTQIEKDISSGLDLIPADLSAVIPEGGIKVPNFSNKFPKKFPI